MPDHSKFLRIPRLSDLSAILLLFAMSAVLVAPAAYYGIPENYDLGQHLRFARTWHNAFTSGELAVSWGAADNHGLGSAGVRFYPPATHMLMGAIQLATGSWYDTLWLTMFAFMFIGGIGVYKLAAEWSSNEIAFYSALLYAIVPYHLLQVFQAFLLAEFAAAAIIPFCFLFAHRLITDGGVKNIALFAASYSALVLTHLPSTIIGSLSLAVFAICFVSVKDLKILAARFAAAFAIALAATAFYWVRMVTELAWIKHNTSEFYASGFYNYSTYFFPMIYSAGDDYGPRFLWLMDICIVLTFALLIPTVIILFKRRADKEHFRPHVAFFSVALFALFMMSLASTPVWDNIATIQKLQFPFRWLGTASLAAAVLFPSAVRHLASTRKVITRTFAYSIASILTLVIVFDLTQIVVPSAPLPREEIARSVAVLDERPGCDCWWPVWAQNSALEEPSKISVAQRDIQIFDWSPTQRTFSLSSGSDRELVIGTFFYPHWSATVNGRQAEVRATGDGKLSLTVPETESVVALRFSEPTRVHASRYLSLTAWIGIFAMLAISFAARRDPPLATLT